MNSSIAIAAALVLASLAFTPGAAAAGSTGHGPFSAARFGHGVTHARPAFGRRWGYGYGYGRGWCYWHPYACYGRAR